MDRPCCITLLVSNTDGISVSSVYCPILWVFLVGFPSRWACWVLLDCCYNIFLLRAFCPPRRTALTHKRSQLAGAHISVYWWWRSAHCQNTIEKFLHPPRLCAWGESIPFFFLFFNLSLKLYAKKMLRSITIRWIITDVLYFIIIVSLNELLSRLISHNPARQSHTAQQCPSSAALFHPGPDTFPSMIWLFIMVHLAADPSIPV